MRWKTKNPLGRFTLRESIEIDEDVASVFVRWNRYEDFPRFTDSVRRTKRIDEECVLWDIDIMGHQVVWEARIVESVPEKLVRWESSWGASNWGEVRFEAVSGGRTHLTVSIGFQPQRVLEHLGARFGLVDLYVRRDIERFREFVESVRQDELDSNEVG
jgi:uncharacterized membrane protein